MRLPTLYIPHGGGPCFFMKWTMGPADAWDKMGASLRALGESLPERPKALLVVSAHWEEPEPTVLTQPNPALLYDYYGFPPHTYELKWPAPGSAPLAKRVRDLFDAAGIASRANAERGFDHGVFIPLLLAFPEADIPTVQLSLRSGLDPEEHLAMGRALAPLRDEGVLIIGSGMSYHNMGTFKSGGSTSVSEHFDTWLTSAVEADPIERDQRLVDWTSAPGALVCHPRSEHLTPLFVAAGAARVDSGRRTFNDHVFGFAVSGFQFG